MVRIAINGLGRVGRLLLRRYCESEQRDVEIVAINDISDLDNLVYLLSRDSVHGRFNGSISREDDELRVNNYRIPVLSESQISSLPWEQFNIDVVIDCTGLCKSRDEAEKHLQAGARKVLVSAPVTAADLTIVMGVNEQEYDNERHHIVSNASCTTNSLAPPLKVLMDNFGIESVLATTVHAYTISQSMVDRSSNKVIQGRAGAINIIPTSTGSDVATVQVLPELEDRIRVTALRVPVADGSITDINAVLKTKVTEMEVNHKLRLAGKTTMAGIIEYSEEDLVSTDIIDNSHSAIIHAKSTRVVKDTHVKVQAWYDNEYGYACRLLETVALMGAK